MKQFDDSAFKSMSFLRKADSCFHGTVLVLLCLFNDVVFKARNSVLSQPRPEPNLDSLEQVLSPGVAMFVFLLSLSISLASPS